MAITIILTEAAKSKKCKNTTAENVILKKAHDPKNQLQTLIIQQQTGLNDLDASKLSLNISKQNDDLEKKKKQIEHEHEIDTLKNKIRRNESFDLNNLDFDSINTSKQLLEQILCTNGFSTSDDLITTLDEACINEEILCEMSDATKEKIKVILKKIGKGLTIGALAGLSVAGINHITGGAISGALAKAISKLPFKAAGNAVSTIAGNKLAKSAVYVGAPALTGAVAGGIRGVNKATDGTIDDENMHN